MEIKFVSTKNEAEKYSSYHFGLLPSVDLVFFFVCFLLLKGKFSSGIEGALASTLHHDFNWKQLSEMIICIFLLMFSKFE